MRLASTQVTNQEFFLKCYKPEKKILDQRQINCQKIVSAGRIINFFSSSHLAPKYFKVVANS